MHNTIFTLQEEIFVIMILCRDIFFPQDTTILDTPCLLVEHRPAGRQSDKGAWLYVHETLIFCGEMAIPRCKKIA